MNTGYPDISLIIKEFRQRVLMSQKKSLLSVSQIFTEKHWSQLVLTVWESHKNNFFLHLLNENNSIKEKGYLNDY